MGHFAKLYSVESHETGPFSAAEYSLANRLQAENKDMFPPADYLSATMSRSTLVCRS